MMRGQWVVVVATILMLPACVFQPHKKMTTKSSPHSEGAGSIFASVTEDSVRGDVRALAQQEDSDTLTPQEQRRLTKKRLAERALERQALLVDIPVPLGAKPLPSFFADGNVAFNKVMSLGYKSEQSIVDIVRFYDQEMERHGWRMMASGKTEHEALQCFIKPDRFCSISSRPRVVTGRHTKATVEIIIFTGPASASC